MYQNTISFMGGLHLPYWKVEDLAYHYLQTTCGFAIQCTRCTQQINPLIDIPEAMVQWKNNSSTFIEAEWYGARNKPRIKLPEGSLVHGCKASEKNVGVHFTWGFILEEMPGNDVGDGQCHLTDIHYDAFFVTALRHQYGTYQCRGAGKSCITEENMVAHHQGWRP